MAVELSQAEQALREAAREYHRLPTRGKISITPTKPLSNQRDLSLAYSPGVAYPCLDIQADPSLAWEYTSRGNLVGVITNGTAVLGLGDIGPLAGKPVMEGKACLFKKFAGIDVFDIELAAERPGQADRDRGGAGADAGRRQPGGHQGAGMLLHRAQAARAHEHPGVPRRPARHGDHHLGGAAQRRWSWSARSIGEVKIAVSGAGAAAIAVPRRDGGPGRQAQERLRVRLQGPDLRRPARRLRRIEASPTRRTPTRARWPMW